MLEGGCLCGEVRYAVDGEIGQVSHCHCSMCRRIHGAAFGTYGAVPKENFRWVSGADSVKTYPSSDTWKDLLRQMRLDAAGNPRNRT